MSGRDAANMYCIQDQKLYVTKISQGVLVQGFVDSLLRFCDWQFEFWLLNFTAKLNSATFVQQPPKEYLHKQSKMAKIWGKTCQFQYAKSLKYQIGFNWKTDSFLSWLLAVHVSKIWWIPILDFNFWGVCTVMILLIVKVVKHTSTYCVLKQRL